MIALFVIILVFLVILFMKTSLGWMVCAIIYTFLYNGNSTVNTAYKEIYKHTFEIQQDLYIQKSDGQHNLKVYPNCPDFNEKKIKKGSKLFVKKNFIRKNFWAGNHLYVVVEVDELKQSGFKAILKKAIYAQDFLTKGSIDGDIAEFDPEILKDMEITTLRQATQYNDLDKVKKFIQEGQDVHKKINGETPLRVAKNIEIMKVLLENEADINTTNKDGETLLHSAVKNKDLEMVKFLIANGALIDQENNKKETPLLIACDYGFHRWEEDVSLTNSVILFLLEKGANVHSLNKWKTTSLHKIVSNGNYEMAAELIKRGAHIDAKNYWGETALFLAAEKNERKIVELLYEAGASLNLTDRKGNTLLHYSGSFEMLCFFVDKKLNVNNINNEGKSVLHQKCHYFHLGSIKYLIEHGGDINLVDNKGRTPLYEALISFWSEKKERKEAALEWVCQNGADIKKVCLTQELLRKFMEKESKELKFFLEQGGSLFQRDLEESTVLHRMCKTEKESYSNGELLNIVQWLIDQGVDVHQIDVHGATALHYACLNEHELLVKLLIEKGVNIHQSDYNNQTPLQLVSNPLFIDKVEDFIKTKGVHRAEK